ncbi:MAG: hypothetical protein LBD15_01440 [Holosporales bacterium]|jgi:cell division protein FtsB|nr:hypothetical protein [Holosporales bacterium]
MEQLLSMWNTCVLFVRNVLSIAQRIFAWQPPSRNVLECGRYYTQCFKARIHAKLKPYSKVDAFITGTMTMMTVTLILLVQQTNYYEHDVCNLTNDRIDLVKRIAKEMKTTEALRTTIEQLETQNTSLTQQVKRLEDQNTSLSQQARNAADAQDTGSVPPPP